MSGDEQEPPLTWVGTEDDMIGGVGIVLARELNRYGLPAHAGLTGLLRHLEGNRAMSEGVLHLTIENQQKLVRFLSDALEKSDARIAELEDES